MTNPVVLAQTVYEHATDALSSGTVIHHWKTSNQPKATLLIQHGFGDYSDRWIGDYPFLISTLAGLDFDVWAMDMHGHGRSPGQRSICDVSQAVDDHIELRTRLTGPNKPPLFILGHSLGGLVTAASAQRYCSDLAGVILLAPALSDPMTPILRKAISFISKMIPTWQVPMKQSGLDGLTSNVEFIDRWNRDEMVFHGQISFLLASTSLNVLAELWTNTASWSLPTLVVHGDKDTYTEFNQSRLFVDKIATADKEFYHITNGRHDVLSDADYVQTWQHVHDWLSQRT